MNIVKRLTVSCFAQVERIACILQDDAAIAEAAIVELEQAYADARSQLHLVKRDGELLREKRDRARKDITQWEERARAAKETDEKKALECVRRLIQSRSDLEEYSKQTDEHQREETKISEQVGRMGELLGELNRKRRLLAAKDRQATALEGVARATSSVSPTSVRRVFDEWESRIVAKSSYSDEPEHEVDELERQCSSEEQEKKMREELAKL